MATLRERLAAAEAQIAFLAGAGVGGVVGRAGVRSTASTVGRAALATPQGRAVLAGISYTALKNELDARDLEFAQAELGSGAASVIGLQQRLTPLPIPLGQLALAGAKAGAKTRKKVKSKFNRAVSAGMKAVRMSTSYGGKNKISDAKRAFTQVTKTASRINKGAKVAKSGILRKIGLAVKKVLK